MRKLVFLCVALVMLAALVSPAVSKEWQRDPMKITLAETWDGAIEEAKVRQVPIIFIWPQRG